MTKVAMIGVGKLGQACAEVMADTYPLVGYDVAPREPKNFPMVDSVKDAVEYADIIFVAAPTPHDPNYDGRQPTHHLLQVQTLHLQQMYFHQHLLSKLTYLHVSTNDQHVEW